MSSADLKSIYEEYFDRIYYFLRKRVYSDDLAFDLTQDTFVRALDYYRPEKVVNVKAWLFKCAYNTFLAHIQKKKVDEKPLDEVELSAELSTTPDYDFKIMRASIEHTLDKKDSFLKELFILRVDYHLTHDEIVEVVGKSKSTVRRAFETIKNLIYQTHRDELDLKLGEDEQENG